MCKTRFGSQAMILNGFNQKKIEKKHQWNLRPLNSGKAMQNVHIFLEYIPEHYLRNYLLSTLWPKFFCLGTRPSQFIEVLNSRVLRPYQHVKHWIKLTMRPGVTWMFLKFLALVDTAAWRHSSRQLVWFSLAFPLDSFSRTCSNSFSRSMLTTIVAGNRFKISISIGYANQ